MTAQPEFSDQPKSSITDNIRHLRNPAIPPFEGRAVDVISGHISAGTKMLDPDMPVISIDDRVHVLTTMRCVGVRHEVDKDGNLVRVQVMKPEEIESIRHYVIKRANEDKALGEK